MDDDNIGTVLSVNFFHLVFVSSKIFNFTDVLFYYAFANRQFRYSTSLHDERNQRVLSSKNVYEIEKKLFPYVLIFFLKFNMDDDNIGTVLSCK
jgi:hypothetical protein